MLLIIYRNPGSIITNSIYKFTTLNSLYNTHSNFLTPAGKISPYCIKNTMWKVPYAFYAIQRKYVTFSKQKTGYMFYVSCFAIKMKDIIFLI